MKSKKFVTVAILLMLCIEIKAQIKVGAKVGANLTDLVYNYKASDNERTTEKKSGIHLGVIVEAVVSDELVLQTGLLFSNKGAILELRNDLGATVTDNGSSSISLNYIDIPIHFAYKMNNFQLYAGPYLGFNLGGNFKEEYSRTITFSSGDLYVIEIDDEFDVKPIFGKLGAGEIVEGGVPVRVLDFGFDVGVGYMIADVLLLNAGYSLGLSNLHPGIAGYDDYDPADFKYSNRVFSVSASYFFGQ